MRGTFSLKTRFYAILGFLALLPLCGVVIAIIGLQTTARDDAVLDHAASGTIHLERINGLVYAADMESQRLYLSPDWQAAEKFAVNLTADLAQLRRELPAWQLDAIASQESNVEELSRRIEEFIRSSGELVRLAKNDGPPAARALGDTAANHETRAALNRSLETLARAYEQEIGRARGKVEAGDTAYTAALAALAVVAGVALCGGFILVRNSLVRPLLWLRDRMLRLAAGDLGAAVGDPRQRAAEIAEMAHAVEAFRSDLIDRQRLNHEAGLLASLDEWLQSANSLHELYDMVGSFLGKLLPGCAGILYIYANSRDVLEGAKGWNGAAALATIHPEDCWGLRRGRTYTFGSNPLDFACAHLGAAAAEPYCCIPILAHGDTIGLLHLKFRAADMGDAGAPDDADIAAQRRLGIICAEHISLAIANVKLRDQLRDQSIRDALTGLFNRRYLLETCRREFARASRAGQSVGVLSIDIDHFKRFNDNHGHDAGDAVLRAVGGCLATIFRSEDVVCRFGGEEFVAILPSADLDVAARRAEHLRSTIEAIALRHLDQTLPRITVSIGAAAFPAFGESPEAVLKAADDALYRAKQKGRNRVQPASSTASAAVNAPDDTARPVEAVSPVTETAPAAPLADAAEGGD